MNTISDIELVHRIQHGDERAMAIVFGRHSALTYSIGLRVLGDPISAEEVLHKVLSRLWHEPEGFVDSRLTLRRWLTLEARKHALVLRAANFQEGTQEQPFLVRAWLLRRPSTCSSALPKALKGRSIKAERLLELAFFEGRTAKEISFQTGLSVTVVKREICQALTAFKDSPLFGGQWHTDA